MGKQAQNFSMDMQDHFSKKQGIVEKSFSS